MSYSRFSEDCNWYTYWSVHPDDDDTKENQLLSISNGEVYQFTYKELTEDLDGCLNEIIEKEGDKNIEELKEYISDFIEDMNEEYK